MPVLRSRLASRRPFTRACRTRSRRVWPSSAMLILREESISTASLFFWGTQPLTVARRPASRTSTPTTKPSRKASRPPARPGLTGFPS